MPIHKFGKGCSGCSEMTQFNQTRGSAAWGGGDWPSWASEYSVCVSLSVSLSLSLSLIIIISDMILNSIPHGIFLSNSNSIPHISRDGYKHQMDTTRKLDCSAVIQIHAKAFFQTRS